MFQRQKSDTKLRRTPSFFTEARHLAEPVEVQPSQEWRVKSTRTHGGVLAVCLNAEVEPPDCVFPRALRTGGVRGCVLCIGEVSDTRAWRTGLPTTSKTACEV